MLIEKSRIGLSVLSILCTGLSIPAPTFAQFSPRYNVPHYHDSAGHRVDAAGHHIDLYGRHTGAVGVYDNGAISVPSYYRGNYGYNGGFYGGINNYPNYSTSPPTGIVQNSVPSPTMGIGRAPQNVIPGAAAPLSAGGQIRIWNPPGTGGEVRYSLNDAEYSIKEGFIQTLDNDRVWSIHFGSGGPRGDIRYTLSAGLYKFKVDSSGWELLRAADQNEYLKNASPGLSPVPAPQSDVGSPGLPPSPQ